jgi:hypothetical protein
MTEQKLTILSGDDLNALFNKLDDLQKKVTSLVESQQESIKPMWVKAPAVCKYFGFSRSVLDRLIAEGKIKAYQVDGRPGTDRYFNVKEIAELDSNLMRPITI